MMVMLLSLWPAKAADMDSLLYSNFNIGSVQSNPEHKPDYLVGEKDIFLHSITTYHWNGGWGAEPGSISIYDAANNLFGTWPAQGENKDTYWVAYPDIVLKKGNHYYFADSDPNTWSHNSESAYTGFIELRGDGEMTSMLPSPTSFSTDSDIRITPTPILVTTGVSTGKDAPDLLEPVKRTGRGELSVMSEARGSDVKLSVDKKRFAPEEEIIVSYTGITQDMVDRSSWICISDGGSLSTNYKSGWQKPAVGSGSVTLQAPFDEGTYEIRFYRASSANDENLDLSTVIFFTVEHPELTKNMAISIPKTVYAPEEDMIVSFSGVTKWLVEHAAWVCISDAGSPSNSYKSGWQKPDVGSGSVILKAPFEEGEYEVRFYDGSSANDLNLVTDLTIPIKVVHAELTRDVSLSIEKAVFAPEEEIVVNYSGVTQWLVEHAAWICISDAGSLSNSYKSGWQKPGVGSGSVILKAPFEEGEYEVRFYDGNSANDLNLVNRLTNHFTVSETVPTLTPDSNRLTNRFTVSETVPTPTPDSGETVKNGVKGAAKGTLSTSGGSVSFSGSGNAEALLLTDNTGLPSGAEHGYDLLLTSTDVGEVTLSVDAADVPVGMVQRLVLGLPYTDRAGVEDYLYIPLESIVSGGRVSASFDPTDLLGAVENVMFSAEGGSGGSAGYMSYQAQLAADAGELNIKLCARFFWQSVWSYTSSKGHFSVNIPPAMYNDDTVPVKGKLSGEDMQRVGEDLEAIFDDYKAVFPKNTRDRWPMDVEVIHGKGVSGRYYTPMLQSPITANYCVMDLNYDGLVSGYKASGTYDNASTLLFHAMAHEMTHFIQWEYTNKNFRAVWFDEATATYYEDREGDKSGVDHTKNAYNEGTDALRQFDGITPASTFFVTAGTAGIDGYARRPLIEYLVKTYGSDFISRFFSNYTVASAGGVKSILTSLTSATMGELARGYYDSMVAKGELEANYSKPWEYVSIRDQWILPVDACDIRSILKLSGKEEGDSHSFTLPRYGAHFIVLEGEKGKLDAAVDSFSVSLDTPGTSAIVMKIHGTSYSEITCYRSWEKKLENFPIDTDSYLILVINESDSSYSGGLFGSKASITVKYHKAYPQADSFNYYPKANDEIPEVYNGTLCSRRLTGAGRGTHYEYARSNAMVRLSLNEEQMLMTVSLTDSQGYTVFSGTMAYDPKTGSFSNADGTVQLEPKNYTSRTEREAPPAMDDGETHNPFISGNSYGAYTVTSEIRIIVSGYMGVSDVFVGKGENDIPEYNDPNDIVILNPD